MFTCAALLVSGKRQTLTLLATAIGSDFKGKISIGGYMVAIPVAFFRGWIAYLLYILVAIMWLIPDRRIERTMSSE